MTRTKGNIETQRERCEQQIHIQRNIKMQTKKEKHAHITHTHTHTHITHPLSVKKEMEKPEQEKETGKDRYEMRWQRLSSPRKTPI